MDQETVWLTANKMALFFGRDEKTIRKHINNVFSEGELVKENNTQKMRVDGVKQPVQFYNHDVIVSVGCNEDYDEYLCSADMDEEDYARLIQGDRKQGPFCRNGEEHAVVRHQM